MTRLTQPNSPVLIALKLVAGAAFLALGLLFIVEDSSWIDGSILVAASAGWLFFVIRNYRRFQLSLESLR